MSQEDSLKRWLAKPERRMIAVAGGKGGVGKTNLSVGLSLAAVELGARSLLIDGDVGMANVDVILGVEPTYDLSAVVSGRVSIDDAICVMPGGLRVLPGASGLVHDRHHFGDPVGQIRSLLSTSGEVFDLVIVDCGSGISSAVLELSRACDEVVVVTTPEPTAIADAYAFIKVFVQTGDHVPRIWLVVNRAQSSFEGEETLVRLIEVASRYLNLEIEPAGYLIEDPAVIEAVRQRRPFLWTEPESLASRRVRTLARTMGLGKDPQTLPRVPDQELESHAR